MFKLVKQKERSSENVVDRPLSQRLQLVALACRHLETVKEVLGFALQLSCNELLAWGNSKTVQGNLPPTGWLWRGAEWVTGADWAMQLLGAFWKCQALWAREPISCGGFLILGPSDSSSHESLNVSYKLIWLLFPAVLNHCRLFLFRSALEMEPVRYLKRCGRSY